MGVICRLVSLMGLCLTLLSGCAASSGPPPIEPVRNTAHIPDMRPHQFVTHPTLGHFTICHGHTCRFISEASLDADEWSSILAIFEAGAQSAVEERELIASAIARFETIVGPKTGTDANLGGNVEGLGKHGQLDCIDEATNTSVYLTLLQNNDLLHWHEVAPRTFRGFTYFNYPHSTAVIREIGTGKRYAVDSWFEGNGRPPHIVPMSLWRRGWEPDRGTGLADTNQ